MPVIACPTCRAKVEVSSATPEVACPACGESIRLDAAKPVPPAPAAAMALEPNSYAVRPYSPRHDGPGRLSGLLITFLVGVVAALLVAGLFYAIKSLVWLVWLFALLQGLALGVILKAVSGRTRARSPKLLALIGLGCGALTVLGLHYCDYLSFEADPGAPAFGFWKYMDLRAHAGIQTQEIGGGHATNHGYAGTLFHWGGEALGTIAIVALATVNLSRKPFCAACRDWKWEWSLGTGSYRLDMGAATAAAAAGCPADMVVPSKSDTVNITVHGCRHCQGEINVFVSGTRPLPNNKRATVKVAVTYPREALADFEKLARDCQSRKLEVSS